MTTYVATIRHHSISRARDIKINGTLTAAKAAATREFDGEQQDYRIVIEHEAGDIASSRLVRNRRWIDHS